MYDKTDGPWHQASAVTCNVLGAYVTIVAPADVATAIAQLVADRSCYISEPRAAMVGRVPVVTAAKTTPAPTRRQLKLDL